ncbi:hypothetical protein COO60DRAFT_767621 [Scenedesmus sp. NREL 46B-D3]|nr:hypothetical protein COO60DRAFT_767621 [Scenedesmus sp. NREL 46B-D3]
MLGSTVQQAAVPACSLSPSAVAPGGGWSSQRMGGGSSAACGSTQAGSSPCLSPHMLCSPRVADACQAGRVESPVSSARASGTHWTSLCSSGKTRQPAAVLATAMTAAALPRRARRLQLSGGRRSNWQLLALELGPQRTVAGSKATCTRQPQPQANGSSTTVTSSSASSSGSRWQRGRATPKASCCSSNSRTKQA